VVSLVDLKASVVSTRALLGGAHSAAERYHYRGFQRGNHHLFWSVRGLGQNFVIIVEAFFETYPTKNGGLQYSLYLTFSQDKLEAVLDVTTSLLIR
jgi:hypothetical protein